MKDAPSEDEADRHRAKREGEASWKVSNRRREEEQGGPKSGQYWRRPTATTEEKTGDGIGADDVVKPVAMVAKLAAGWMVTADGLKRGKPG